MAFIPQKSHRGFKWQAHIMWPSPSPLPSHIETPPIVDIGRMSRMYEMAPLSPSLSTYLCRR